MGKHLTAAIAACAAICLLPSVGRSTGAGLEYTAYKGLVKHVVDGDTLDVQLYLGLSTYRDERIRLRCVNAPEMKGASKPQGQVSKDFVEHWAQEHPSIVVRLLKDDERDVYGRLLVILFAADEHDSLNQQLLERNFGVLFMCKSAAELL